MTEFWESAFNEKQLMWGLAPTASASLARDTFTRAGVKSVLIPGIGNFIQAFGAARVVNQHINFPGERARPLGELVNARRAADVERVKMCFGCSGFLRLHGDAFEPVNTARAENDLRSFSAERACRRRAEPTRSTGDDHPFVCKS